MAGLGIARSWRKPVVIWELPAATADTVSAAAVDTAHDPLPVVRRAVPTVMGIYAAARPVTISTTAVYLPIYVSTQLCRTAGTEEDGKGSKQLVPARAVPDVGGRWESMWLPGE